MAITLESLAERIEQLERKLEQLIGSRVPDEDINLRAFLAVRADLERQFQKEYVAFADGRLVGHDVDRDRLLDRLYREFPGKTIFYKQLLPTEPVYRIPSPRLS